jgi:LPS-assembly protein
VTIARASSLLTADEVRINRDTQIGEARGNVNLTDPQGSIQADSLKGNFEDETGELTNGSINLTTSQMTINGERLVKSFGQTYHIENGVFTTCRCGAGAPSWSIAGSDIDITLDGYGYVRNATFRILDVPVLYLPWAAFPAKTSRQTGLLAPQFGYSGKRGFEYLQPLYININKSADVTVAGDIETDARVGGLGEYRWALDRTSKGVLNGTFFNESLRTNANRDIVNTNVADPDIPENRWSETASIEQELPLGIRFFADSLAVSDDFFLREIPTFSFDPAYAQTLRTSRFDTSRAGLLRSWDHATIIAEAEYFQDFIQEDDLTLQRLPEVLLFASDRFLDRHLKLGVNAEFTNFARRKGFDGERGDVTPRAEVPFRLQEYLRGRLGIQYRETGYHMENTDLILPLTQSGGIVDPATLGLVAPSRNSSREIYQADASISSEVSRIFEVDGEDVTKLKHTIEPGVDYRFVPDVNQEDLPTFDFVDRIERRNQFTYGFTSRLLAKLATAPAANEERLPYSVADLNSFRDVSASPFDDERTRGGLHALGDVAGPGERQDPTAAEPSGPTRGVPEAETADQRAARLADERSAISHIVEWGRLQIFQSYDLDQSLRTERIDHFSDVDAILRVTPSRLFSLRYESSVDARDQRLTAASISLVMRDPRPRSAEGLLQSGDRASLGVGYRFISDNRVEELDGALTVPLADTLSVFYLTRYDQLARTFLENTGGFRFFSQCRCWILDLAVSNRVNPNETEVRAQVTLVGLGSIGRSR